VGKTRAYGANCQCTAHGIGVGIEAGPSQIVVLQNPGTLIYRGISTRQGADTLYVSRDRWNAAC